MSQSSTTALDSPEVCIVSSQHPARNPRVVKEADALAAAGVRVEVLTIASHAATLPRDRALLAGRSWPLRYGVDLTGLAGGSRRLAFLYRLRTRLATELNVRLRLHVVDALGAVRPLLHAALRRRARLYIAHVDAGIWVGRELLRRGCRTAADFEDWHSEDLLPSDRRRLPLAALREAEGTLLRQAAFTTTTSAALARALDECYGGRMPLVVPNAFPLQSDPRRTPPGEPPAFFWFSQTLGPGRGLESFLAAWAGMREPSRCVLLGEAVPGFRAQLLELLPAGRRAALSFLPLVPPEQLPALIAQHDIGLALESAAPPSRNLTITNKILQYFNAGLAVAASDTAGQREALSHRPEAGVILPRGDVAAVTRALDDFIHDRAALASRQRSARRLAEEHYCWGKIAPIFVDAVRAALRSSSTPASSP